MSDEVTKDDVYAIVERETGVDSHPTTDEIAAELNILPAEALEILAQLRRDSEVEKSERESGKNVWYASDQVRGAG